LTTKLQIPVFLDCFSVACLFRFLSSLLHFSENKVRPYFSYLQLLMANIRVLWPLFVRFVLFLQQIGYFLSALLNAMPDESVRSLIMYNNKQD